MMNIQPTSPSPAQSQSRKRRYCDDEQETGAPFFLEPRSCALPSYSQSQNHALSRPTFTSNHGINTPPISPLKSLVPSSQQSHPPQPPGNKRHVSAPLTSHLQQNTIRMMMQGSRQYSRSLSQKSQSVANTPCSSLSPQNWCRTDYACSDCGAEICLQDPAQQGFEEYVIQTEHTCGSCGNIVCSQCCIVGALYSNNDVDCLRCLGQT